MKIKLVLVNYLNVREMQTCIKQIFVIMTIIMHWPGTCADAHVCMSGLDVHHPHSHWPETRWVHQVGVSRAASGTVTEQNLCGQHRHRPISAKKCDARSRYQGSLPPGCNWNSCVGFAGNEISASFAPQMHMRMQLHQFLCI